MEVKSTPDLLIAHLQKDLNFDYLLILKSKCDPDSILSSQFPLFDTLDVKKGTLLYDRGVKTGDNDDRFVSYSFENGKIISEKKTFILSNNEHCKSIRYADLAKLLIEVCVNGIPY